jgi:hypothetical protein
MSLMTMTTLLIAECDFFFPENATGETWESVTDIQGLLACFATARYRINMASIS